MNDLIEGVKIEGNIMVAGAVVVCTAASDTVTIVASAETIGDTYIIRSDGVNWYVTGDVAVTAGATCTQASA